MNEWNCLSVSFLWEKNISVPWKIFGNTPHYTIILSITLRASISCCQLCMKISPAVYPAWQEMNKSKMVLNFLSPSSDISTFNTLEHSIFKHPREDRFTAFFCPKSFLTPQLNSFRNYRASWDVFRVVHFWKSSCQNLNLLLRYLLRLPSITVFPPSLLTHFFLSLSSDSYSSQSPVFWWTSHLAKRRGCYTRGKLAWQTLIPRRQSVCHFLSFLISMGHVPPMYLQTLSPLVFPPRGSHFSQTCRERTKMAPSLEGRLRLHSIFISFCVCAGLQRYDINSFSWTF